MGQNSLHLVNFSPSQSVVTTFTTLQMKSITTLNTGIFYFMIMKLETCIFAQNNAPHSCKVSRLQPIDYDFHFLEAIKEIYLRSDLDRKQIPRGSKSLTVYFSDPVIHLCSHR